MNLDKITNAVADGMAEIALHRYEKDSTIPSEKELYLFVGQEYATRKLHARIRRFLNRNPVLLQLNAPEAIITAVFREIAEELITQYLGAESRKIPRGIQEGDMWLTPSSEVQRDMQDRKGDSAVLVVMAKLVDGQLEPSFFWTENEEIIAEAQKGHRRYKELLARMERS